MKVRIDAGPHRRQGCPIALPIAPSEGSWLVSESGDVRLPLQPHPEQEGAACAVLPELGEGASARFTVEQGGSAEPRVVCTDDGQGKVDVKIDGAPFTTYHYGDAPKPYFHPVFGPDGVNLVRNYPMLEVEGEPTDHPHHRGFWTAHGERKGMDNWLERDGSGRIVPQSVEASSGPVYGQIRAKNIWVTTSGHNMLDEARTLTVYAVSGDARLMDYTLELKASYGDYVFEDTKESGLISWRVASWMDGKAGGHLQNAYGARTEAEVWGKRAPWCDYWAEKDGERYGVAIFDHAANYMHPTYWHIRAYGLFTANPFGLTAFKAGRHGALLLPKGSSITFRYRVFLHKGSTEEAEVSERYHDFANAPKVVVEE